MSGKARHHRLLLILGLLAIFAAFSASTHSPSSTAGSYRFPMAGSGFLLAGTFGELRSNHFHSGIDIKTGGGVGQPLYAVRDGYIYRIKVSPFGFGKAIYLRHQDGDFSVYGHMNGFTPSIEDFVYQKQYATKQYEQEIYLDEGQMPVSKGDLIGYSGNSGASSGPHLHFEIRDPQERIVNPLLHYRAFVSDHKKPEVRGIALEPLTIHARVNCRFEKYIPKLEGSNGDYHVQDVIKVRGKVGLEYDAFDQLDGAANACGINYARLYLDQQLIYEFALDTFSFDDKRYINVHFDYQHHKAGGRKFQRSYIESGNQLPCYPRSKDRGIIELQDDAVHSLRLELADGYQNTSTVRLNVQRQGHEPLPTSLSGGQGQALRAAQQRNVGVLRLAKPVNSHLQGLAVTYKDGSTSTLKPAYMLDGELVFLLDLTTTPLPAAVTDPVTGQQVTYHLSKLIQPARDNTVEMDELQVFLPAGCVFDSMPLHLRRLPPSSNSLSASYEVGRIDQPTLMSFVLQFTPPPSAESSRLVVARKQGNRWVYVGNEHKPDGTVAAATSDFGTFCLLPDTLSPRIKALNFKDGSAIPPTQKTLSLQVSDEFSGLNTQKILCTIDGTWQLFEFDAKGGTLTHTLRHRPGRTHALQVFVYDQAGNLAQQTFSLTF